MAIRADIIERLDKLIYNQIEMDKKNQNFVITDEMIALLGCSRENIKFVIKYLGFTEINKNIKTSSSDDANEIEIKYKKKYKSKSNNQKKLKKAKHAKVGGESSNIFSENIDLINLKERL